MQQEMMNRLLNNLHPAINSDPQQTNALSITGSGTVIINQDTMQLIGASGSAQYNLRSYTLGALATAISSVSGFTATCIVASNLSAATLIAGTYVNPTTLPMFTSFMWQILKTVAIAMVDALGAENNALLEMILTTSDGSWLDAFGELFGVTREIGEPDQLYTIRIFDLSVGTRVNNFAIQKALQDLQYIATVTDSGTASFNVNVTLPSSPPQGFVYSSTQIRNLIDQLRAAGVSYVIQNKGSLSDAGTIGDAYTVSKSSALTKYNSGRKWGQGIWAK